MAVVLRDVGQYIQGAGELDNLGKFVKKLGNKFLLICSPNNKQRIGDRIETALKSVEKEMVYSEFHNQCTMEAIEKAVADGTAAGCDIVIGAGGGTAIDTAKAVATKMGGIPCVIIPTIASNDAPCAGLSVVYNEEGVVVKVINMVRNPDVVLVDTGVIAQAPRKFLVSGMGDALATYFEARACWRTGARTMARGNCSHTSLAMAKLCYDLLLEHSVKALEAVDRNEVNEDLENVVEACIYLSGFGAICGGLAAAHAINDGLGAVPQIHANGTSHGEKVAFGLIAQLILEKAPKEEWNTVLDYIHAVGLPSTLADLGVTEFVEADIRRAAKIAASPKEFTKNVRADITADEVHEAILAADKAGAAK